MYLKESIGGSDAFAKDERYRWLSGSAKKGVNLAEIRLQA